MSDRLGIPAPLQPTSESPTPSASLRLRAWVLALALFLAVIRRFSVAFVSNTGCDGGIVVGAGRIAKAMLWSRTLGQAEIVDVYDRSIPLNQTTNLQLNNGYDKLDLWLRRPLTVHDSNLCHDGAHMLDLMVQISSVTVLIYLKSLS